MGMLTDCKIILLQAWTVHIVSDILKKSINLGRLEIKESKVWTTCESSPHWFLMPVVYLQGHNLLTYLSSKAQADHAGYGTIPSRAHWLARE